MGCFGSQRKLASTKRKYIGSERGLLKDTHTGFGAGFSALHPAWLLAQAADTPDLTLAQNNSQKKRERGRLFPLFCLLQQKASPRALANLPWSLTG